MPGSRTARRKTIVLGAAVAMCLAAGASLPAGAATDQYVALGDSYSAGNGAFSNNLDVSCNRNTYAYPYLTSQQRPGTELSFVACQGAKTDDIVGTQSRSLNADTDLVSLTIGGNDVGFVNLIISCAGEFSPGCKTAVDDVNRRIRDELPAKLDKAYGSVKAAAPGARNVVVLGYPRAFGQNLSCAAAKGVTAEEAGWLNGVSDNLDAAIGPRAKAAGFSYQSSIRSFTGHDVCATDPYLNGNSPSPADAWHPTRSGYANGFAPLLRQVVG